MKYSLLTAFGLALLAAACQQGSPENAVSEPAAAAVPDSVYLAKGKEIAAATFANLSSRLQAAMQSGGVPEAVPYCQLSAHPIVDSLSKVYNADIRRTSTRVRNPANRPTAEELAILEIYEKQAAAAEALQPQIVRGTDGTVHFYAPIKILPLCLNCHGKAGETLTAENNELIKKLYPEDTATGYAQIGRAHV